MFTDLNAAFINAFNCVSPPGYGELTVKCISTCTDEFTDNEAANVMATSLSNQMTSYYHQEESQFHQKDHLVLKFESAH